MLNQLSIYCQIFQQGKPDKVTQLIPKKTQTLTITKRAHNVYLDSPISLAMVFIDFFETYTQMSSLI